MAQDVAVYDSEQAVTGAVPAVTDVGPSLCRTRLFQPPWLSDIRSRWGRGARGDRDGNSGISGRKPTATEAD